MMPMLPRSRFLIQHTNLFVAWLFNLIYSMALVFVSTWCVVFKAPQAAGAGVAEVMAFLNGCQLPRVSSLLLRTVLPRASARESN